MVNIEESKKFIFQEFLYYWITKNILNTRREEILLFLYNSELSADLITLKLTKKAKISKPGVIKHLKMLEESKIVESKMIFNEKGRLKLYKLSAIGKISWYFLIIRLLYKAQQLDNYSSKLGIIIGFNRYPFVYQENKMIPLFEKSVKELEK